MTKNITDLPLADWIHNLKDRSLKWKPTVDPAFLPHCLPLLASTPLVRVAGKISANETIKSLDTGELINTPNGKVPARTIRNLIGFLYLASRSSLQKEAMTKNPTLGSLTPLWMYAHKLHHDIPYEDWNKKDLAIHYALGRFLENIVDYNTTKMPKQLPFSTSDLFKSRTLALTPVKGGEPAALVSNKMNLKKLPCIVDETEVQRSYDKAVMYMLLQTWLANAALRVPNVMILDPLNWDNVPKAYDQVAQIAAEPPTAPTERIQLF